MIFYSEGLVQSWEKSLTTAFSRSPIRLSRRGSKGAERFSISIQPECVTETHAEAENQPSAPIVLLGDSPVKYHYSFKATFELWTAERGRQRSSVLQHVSLTVYQDIPLVNQVPIFRAEWDPRAVEDAESSHAQPHWHFTPQTDSVEQLVRKVFGSGVTDFDPEPEPTHFGEYADLGRFHFAMGLHRDPDGVLRHKRGFQSEEELREWFEAMTAYISEQLMYLSAKTASSKHQNVTEFKIDDESIEYVRDFSSMP